MVALVTAIIRSFALASSKQSSDIPQRVYGSNMLRWGYFFRLLSTLAALNCAHTLPSAAANSPATDYEQAYAITLWAEGTKAAVEVMTTDDIVAARLSLLESGSLELEVARARGGLHVFSTFAGSMRGKKFLLAEVRASGAATLCYGMCGEPWFCAGQRSLSRLVTAVHASGSGRVHYISAGESLITAATPHWLEHCNSALPLRIQYRPELTETETEWSVDWPHAHAVSFWIDYHALVRIATDVQLLLSLSSSLVCTKERCFPSESKAKWRFIAVTLTGSLTLCRDNASNCEHLGLNGTPLNTVAVSGTGRVEKLSFYTYPLGHEETALILERSDHRALLERNLVTSHSTIFAYERQIAAGDVHYWTLANNNRTPDYLDLVMRFTSGTGTFNLAVYKPYPTCVLLSITSTAAASYNRVTSTDAAGCGGLQGALTIEVKSVSGSFRYSLDVTASCADDGSNCFCSSGNYPDSAPPVCRACPAGSYECANYRTLRCMPSYLGTAVISGLFDCHPCASGSALNTATGLCVSCHATCQSCSVAGDSTKCSMCYQGATLSSGPPGSCICATGYYPNPGAGQCAACAKTCAQCSSGGSAGCTACLPGAALVGGVSPGTCQCLVSPTTAADSCNCHTTCFTCSGTSSNSCLECKSNAQLLGASPNSCVCVAGYYPAPDSAACAPCNSLCLTCTSAKNCSTCRAPAVLAQTGFCQCGAGYFPFPDAATCLRCSASCATCSGPQGCTSCAVGALLDGSSQCQCMAGYFPNPDAAHCSRCSNLCATCSTATTCDSCKHNAQLAQATCTCLVGFYLSASFDCLQCGQNCAYCTEVACVVCSSGLLHQTQCVSACPLGYAERGTLCESIELSPPVAVLTVTIDNSLLVNFDKLMNFTLLRTDVSVDLADPLGRAAGVSWQSPEFNGDRQLLIRLIFDSGYIVLHTKVFLTFLHPENVTDLYGIPIQSGLLEGELRESGSPPQNETEAELLSTETARKTSAGIKSAVSVGIATSLLSGNPLSFMLIINQLQLFSYITMSRIDLPADFASTLAALNAEGVLPMILSPEHLQAEWYVRDFGVESCVFLANALNIFLVWAAIALVYACLLFCANVRNPEVANYASGFLTNLRWAVPLNTWLTSYLDIGIFAMLQLQKAPDSFSNAFLGVSFCFAVAACVLFLATPFALLFFINWNINHIGSRRDLVFNKRWGQLFLEFKQSDKFFGAMWYPLFAFRRFALAITLVFGANSPTFVAVFNTSFAGLVQSTQVVLYLAVQRPFDAKFQQVEMTLVEGNTLLVYLFVCAQMNYHDQVLEITAVWVVRMAVATTVVLAMCRSALSIGRYAKKLLNSRASRYRMADTHANYDDVCEVYDLEGTINTRIQPKSP